MGWEAKQRNRDRDREVKRSKRKDKMPAKPFTPCVISFVYPEYFLKHFGGIDFLPIWVFLAQWAKSLMKS